MFISEDFVGCGTCGRCGDIMADLFEVNISAKCRDLICEYCLEELKKELINKI